MAVGDVRVKPLEGNADLNRFVRLPWRLYQDDPAWVPPLLFERKQALSPSEPFFRHARWQGWLAWRDGEVVGRISAQVDDLYQARYDDATGYFGMLEAVDDQAVFDALFAAAEKWLRDQGMQRVAGPFNLGINQELGLLDEGFETPPYFMMGHARRYYRKRIEAAGYALCQTLLAYLLKTRYDDPERVQKLRARLAQRVTVRELDRSRKSAELELMRDIFNDAWAENWGFVPWTEEEFAAIGDLLLLALPKDFVLFAEVDGEAAGFIVLMPNLNEVIADLNGRLLPFGWAKLLWRLKVRFPKTARVPLMGVRRKLHDTRFGPGVATILIDAARVSADRHGVVENELSWILESNAGMRSIIERIGGRVSKRYVMFDKTLCAP